MNSGMHLKEIWKTLEDEFAGEKGYTGVKRRRILPESDLDVYLAMDGVHFSRYFLLVLENTANEANFKTIELRGLRVYRGRLVAGDAEEAIIIQLKDIRYAELFDHLLTDLADHLQTKSNLDDAISLLLARVESWRSMTAAADRGMLTISEQTGLFGELWFMKYIQQQGLNNIVSAWHGPLGAVHDFQWGFGAVEIKATITENPQTIRISSESQLDTSGIPQLFLWHLTLSEHKSGDLTLPELIESIADNLSPPELEIFNQRLTKTGYSDLHRDVYLERRYILRNTSIFEVRGDFPRMTVAELRRGISNVAYDIQLQSCSDFLVEEAKLLQVVRGE